MLRLDRLAFLRNRKNDLRKFVIKIPSDIGCIKKVSSKIVELLLRNNVHEDRIFDIKLCVEEAVRNAIVHGNNSHKKLRVKIVYWIEGGNINIEVEDEGKGFDHSKVDDPTLDENILRNCGRGVFLIKKLMDDVRFNKSGNNIKMAKKLN